MDRQQGGSTPLPRGAVGAFLAAAALVLAFVVAANLFFLVGAPLRAEYRAAVPGDSYFLQSWRLFAPSPLATNRELEVQLRWRDEAGGVRESGWIPVTRLELRAVTVVPSRVAKVSRYALQHFESAPEDDRAAEDLMMTGYASHVAAAWSDDEAVEVRWRVIRQRVNDFERRHEPESQYEPSVTEYDWHPAQTELDPRAVAEFRAVFERLGALDD